MPKRNYVRINVDAGFFEDTMQFRVGMIIRDDDGVFIVYRILCIVC